MVPGLDKTRNNTEERRTESERCPIKADKCSVGTGTQGTSGSDGKNAETDSGTSEEITCDLLYTRKRNCVIIIPEDL